MQRAVFQNRHNGRKPPPFFDHLTGRVEKIHPDAGTSGHGGGDEGLMAAFVRAVRNPSNALTTARESLESHLMAFAAEEARVNGTVVDMRAYREQAEMAGACDQ